MMKGYLTIFLSLSLSLLTGFLLLFVGNAINNAWKVRLEGAADIGMNSVLGEYHIKLHERYGLLYVDVSYDGSKPSLANMEGHLAFYISRNLRKSKNGPLGDMVLTGVQVTDAVSSAAHNGLSMKRQAAQYVQDCRIENENAQVYRYIGEMSKTANLDAEEAWCELMNQIKEMELPLMQNEEGIWEEVPLANPADGIFSMLGSDIFYLTGVDVTQISTAKIQKNDYISERDLKNAFGKEQTRIDKADTELFLSYLLEKMGSYKAVRQDSLLQFQLEYITKGKASDYENLQAVIRQMIRWRFAVNVQYIFGNAEFHQDASEIANMLTVVQLNPAFGEPVIKSILYACAYLEAIGDVRCLLEGGRVSPVKSRFFTEIEQVLTGEIAKTASNNGLSYEQYLLYMLYMLPENTRNLRAMDIMEMDIRKITGNSNFAMDFCIERYTAQIEAAGNWGVDYCLSRTYGYY